MEMIDSDASVFGTNKLQRKLNNVDGFCFEYILE